VVVVQILIGTEWASPLPWSLHVGMIQILIDYLLTLEPPCALLVGE
jgi:hypothetical protein